MNFWQAYHQLRVTTEHGHIFQDANQLGEIVSLVLNYLFFSYNNSRCKHLPKSPKHGMVIAPKIDHGMKAKFTCKDGFELKGNLFIECSYGNWTGEIPICSEGEF